MRPLMLTPKSADCVIDVVPVCVLFDVLPSMVELAALVVTLSVLATGVLKVLVQVIELPTAKVGAGLGAQIWVAPEGRPFNAQVGVCAVLGPLLMHTPLTVIGWPTVTLAGMVVMACMSACGTTPIPCCDWLLPGAGSMFSLSAVPLIVALTTPFPGAM